MSQPDPDILVDLTTCASAFEAEVIRDALQQSGIPAFASTTVGAMNPWEVASSMPLRVQVRRRDLEAANAELVIIREDAREIDWSNEDVGAPEAGELAAAGPGDSEWKARHDEKETLAKTALGLGAMAAYGPLAIVITFFGLLFKGKRQAKGTDPANRSKARE